MEALTTHNTLLPPMSLTGKDHKKIVDEDRGPKRRAVVSANEGSNDRVSNLTAKILNEVADLEDSKTECKSAEGLQAKVEDLNKRLHLMTTTLKMTGKLWLAALTLKPGIKASNLSKSKKSSGKDWKRLLPESKLMNLN